MWLILHWPYRVNQRDYYWDIWWSSNLFSSQIPLGIQIGTAIRVGQYVGANKPIHALNTARLSITIAGTSFIDILSFVKTQIGDQQFQMNSIKFCIVVFWRVPFCMFHSVSYVPQFWTVMCRGEVCHVVQCYLVGMFQFTWFIVYHNEQQYKIKSPDRYLLCCGGLY